MLTLVMLIGLPASGKSSFYQSRFACTHRLISKDLLKNNKRKNRRQEQLLEAAFQDNKPVVLDNTHPSAESRYRWIEWAKTKGWGVHGYYLSCSVDECRRRNEKREPREKVPDVGFFTILRDLDHLKTGRSGVF